jgi:hypothetical protein
MSKNTIGWLLVIIGCLIVCSSLIIMANTSNTISFSRTDKIIVSAAVIRGLNLPPEVSKLNIVCPQAKCTPSEIVLVSNVLSGSVEESSLIISKFKEVTGEQ